MQTQASTINVRNPNSNRTYQWIVAVALVTTGIGQAAAADDGDYYHDALLNPSKAVLLAEHRGRVTIFDGLDEDVVDRALDEQFERIDHMMFIRTRHVQEDGVVASDDDC
ncbi:MAG: hypothetical protein H6959_10370 [Chromatiaceae bacterium]|nr:hypothetical protein [Gammaproteobacteria bacterium]MCP5423312.1 hypothetical protein [Chromatiaceae bacterium]